MSIHEFGLEFANSTGLYRTYILSMWFYAKERNISLTRGKQSAILRLWLISVRCDRLSQGGDTDMERNQVTGSCVCGCL
ncbi:hypothetical protein [Aulosira sp. FACHB-615]|uniref:hypothetical protein n=1 Tax=Aulosira sp. FACHB-615 TaxID=2692777 RepID=UPI001687083F|nr:hypothetical protein [Aulosira sp. FACHB-615]MBD2491976.1 hypothetical protein [Aulosira sp. FACHB-615]